MTVKHKGLFISTYYTLEHSSRRSAFISLIRALLSRYMVLHRTLLSVIMHLWPKHIRISSCIHKLSSNWAVKIFSFLFFFFPSNHHSIRHIFCWLWVQFFPIWQKFPLSHMFSGSKVHSKIILWETKYCVVLVLSHSFRVKCFSFTRPL